MNTVKLVDHGNSASPLVPRAKSLPRVHYKLGSDVSMHVSKCYIRGGDPSCYKNLIRWRGGVVNIISEEFLQRERTSLAGNSFLAHIK